MKRIPCCFLAISLLLFLGSAGAGTWPGEKSILNSSRVYFEEAFVEQADSYELLLDDSLDFSGQGLRVLESALPAFWLYKLDWGKSYYWKVRALDKNKKELGSPQVHRFSIVALYRFKYFEELRLKVISNRPARNAGGYVCMDYARAIYNREGKPCWVLPDIGGLINEKSQIRDLRLTKDNTLTFLIEQGMPLEIDLSGNVLWKAPFPLVIGKDTIAYHHDFKKTGRGTYMVLGNKKVYRKILGSPDKRALANEYGIKITDTAVYRLTEIGLVIEFDRSGKIKWLWDADGYLRDEDLNYKKASNGVPNTSTHMNAFCENAEGTKVYVGFRDLSRITRIDKKTKKAETSFGEKYPSGEAKYANNLFNNQHDANVTGRRSILLFNNNGARGGGVSGVIELRDQQKDTLPVWQFSMKFDSLSSGKSQRGGNVQELPGGNLLVCGGQLNRVIEVTRAKEVVWDVFVESRGLKDSLWQPFPLYRTSWLKELREYHFLCKANAVKESSQPLSIQVYNTGASEDQYLIKIYKAGGMLLETIKTPQLAPGKDLSAKVSKSNLPLYSYITVESAAEPWKKVELAKGK